MNKLFLGLVTILMLSACSNLTKWIPSDFDNAEFRTLAELNVVSKTTNYGWCSQEEVFDIDMLSGVLVVYSKYRLNDNITGIYSNIDFIVGGLHDRVSQPGTPPSDAYCKLKRTQIAEDTEKVLEIFGDRK